MIEPLYFSSISLQNQYQSFWCDLYKKSPKGGKFFIDVARRLGNNRLIARHGEWSLPWDQHILPGFEMPEYDETFNLEFDKITDSRSSAVLDAIEQGKKIAIMYSGGIDSTVIMVSILKNIPSNYWPMIYVCASSESLIENPVFWENHVRNNFKIIDSSKIKFDDLIEQNFVCVIADEGDCLFGTAFGLNLYFNYDSYLTDLSYESRINLSSIKNKISDPDIHFSRYKDILIKHLSLKENIFFGELFYEKIVKNIKTSSVPVVSLHDFFWWLIFNLKYVNCSARGAIYFNDRISVDVALKNIINWFSTEEYQKWSMVNNNNGRKIKSSLASYKCESKNYIYEYDGNDWYRSFKIKIESLWNIGVQQDISKIDPTKRPDLRSGLDKNYQLLHISDQFVRDFYSNKLTNYNMDW